MPTPHAADAHETVEALLPWYVSGQLDHAERSAVEDHLSSCTGCQRELDIERLLLGEVQSLAPEIEVGWARLRARISRTGRRPKFTQTIQDFWNTLRRPAVATLALAQIMFVLIAAGVLLSLSRPEYRTLGTPEATPAGNIIVIFRSDATEEEIRQTLRTNGASLVGGPTSADAYVLHVPADRRESALTRLQADDDVEVAQPIDGVSQ